MADRHTRVLERLDRLPDAVWDCERCDTNGSMQLRRSSLNDAFLADDIGLKCSWCRFYATHGIPFRDQSEYAREREQRAGRVLDFARDGPRPSVSENLAALGYTAAADMEDEPL